MVSSKTEDLIKAGLRSIAASVPVAASISQAWNEYESSQQNKRIDEFFAFFKKELEQVKEQVKQMESYIKGSGEIPALLEQVIQRIRYEPNINKTRKYAFLLTKCICSGNIISYEEKLNYIELLDFIGEEDVKILKIFYPNKNIRVEDIGGRNPIRTNESDKQLSNLVFSLSKLEARGLISETHDNIHRYLISGDKSFWTTRWGLKHYTLLPYGKNFLEITGHISEEG